MSSVEARMPNHRGRWKQVVDEGAGIVPDNPSAFPPSMEVKPQVESIRGVLITSLAP